MHKSDRPVKTARSIAVATDNTSPSPCDDATIRVFLKQSSCSRGIFTVLGVRKRRMSPVEQVECQFDLMSHSFEARVDMVLPLDLKALESRRYLQNWWAADDSAPNSHMF